ncbi:MULTISPECIES: hypothetical protein [Corynebacterium]|nr:MULTISPECIES: hypothetical protein [Corynebacterium]QJS15379.1 hypothetical protein HK412_03265 [Corynebacterium glutamicum]QXU46671.1 hypothetical protein KW808_05235 [[Brevibacterium] flavum]
MNDLYSFRQALYDIRERFGLLDDLLTPAQNVGGERMGSGVPGSRPPLAVGIVDLKVDVEKIVGKWYAEAVRTLKVSGLDSCSVLLRTDWLREIGPLLLDLPWFERMTEELLGIAGLLIDVVDVPGISPWSRDVRDRSGTAREIVRWVQAAGMKVSRWQVQSWIAAGVIPAEKTPDGRLLVRFEDVIEQARQQLLPLQPPEEVS